jgi:signal transduction histidine kinase
MRRTTGSSRRFLLTINCQRQYVDIDAMKALEAIERNARAQAQLVEDLLDVSRVVTGKLRRDVRPTDTITIVEAAVEALRPAADAKGVRLLIVPETSAAPVMGGPERLQQVVSNPLSNAVKFTPHGGHMEVRVERINSHVEISVGDKGVGIAQELLPHVFNRFRQQDGSTTRRHGGLGLSIVRHLVEMHGGRVRAESRGEGHGSTFTVTLPLAPIRPSIETRARLLSANRESVPAYECQDRLDGFGCLSLTTRRIRAKCSWSGSAPAAQKC